MNTSKLSDAELNEVRQRFTDDFYHITHKGVVAHVGQLLEHITALTIERNQLENSLRNVSLEYMTLKEATSLDEQTTAAIIRQKDKLQTENKELSKKLAAK